MNMMLDCFNGPDHLHPSSRSCPRKFPPLRRRAYCLRQDDRAASPELSRGFPVADELDYEIYQDRKRLPRRRGRARRLLLIVAALAVIAAGSAYGWFNYGRLVQPASSAPSSVAAAAARNAEETVALKDFQSFRQQTAQSLQSMDQGIAAQKADLTRLSDQLSALATRLDALQTAAAPAAPPVAPARPA